MDNADYLRGLAHSAFQFHYVLCRAAERTCRRSGPQIDGASKWQSMAHVVVPHLMPVIVCYTDASMDNFRVFEPIISFSAQAHAQSLSYFIFNDLRESGNPLYASAGATSILTILGVMILLTPVLIRTWRDFNRKGH